MSKFLKGNYEIKDGNEMRRDNKTYNNNVEALFEKKAMEKLGGSIAFVMKGNKFLWDGENDTE